MTKYRSNTFYLPIVKSSSQAKQAIQQLQSIYLLPILLGTEFKEQVNKKLIVCFVLCIIRSVFRYSLRLNLYLFGRASDILLLGAKRKNVCLSMCNHDRNKTLRSILTKIYTQIFKCKVSVSWLMDTISKWRQF